MTSSDSDRIVSVVSDNQSCFRQLFDTARAAVLPNTKYTFFILEPLNVW